MQLSNLSIARAHVVPKAPLLRAVSLAFGELPSGFAATAGHGINWEGWDAAADNRDNQSLSMISFLSRLVDI